jgi:hypothetical protein
MYGLSGDPTVSPDRFAVLDTMLALREEQLMSPEPSKTWFRIWMLAILMILVAIAGMHWLSWSHLAASVCEALLIAGILTLAVDPLVKRDLLREASQGIFVHLLGFEHHPQVKDKLKDIVYGTKILRTKLHNTMTVEEEDGGFLVTIDYDSEIINATNLPVNYEPAIDWDMAHRPEMLRMSFTSSDGKVKWTEKNVPLDEIEPGVQKASPHRVSLQPNERGGVVYKGSGTFRVFTKHAYLITYTGIPTLITSTRVILPDGYEASATKADIQNEDYWEWNGIRMPGYHTTIRWRKREGEWL